MQRGVTKIEPDAAQELRLKIRQELGDKVFDATIDAIKTEVSKPDFDPATSPLLESHGGGGSLLLLIEELFGFGGEVMHEVVKT